jgi:hypothetical protein
MQGEFTNKSRYIRVEIHPDYKLGGGVSGVLPFGFMGPARRPPFQISSVSETETAASGYDNYKNSYAYHANSANAAADFVTAAEAGYAAFTGSFNFPDYALRVTASNAVRGLARRAYFGLRTNRSDASIYPYNGYADLTYPLAGRDSNSWEDSIGDSVHNFTFSLDDVQQLSSSAEGWLDDAGYAAGQKDIAVTSTSNSSISARGVYYNRQGPTAPAELTYEYSNSVGWKTTLDAGYNSFTMPMHGGFDGVDIKQKDPFCFNEYDGGATAQGREKYAWFSIFTAVRMLKDPEFLDFDLAAVPGVFDSDLNTKLANYCQDRGDSLALLDVDSGYRPLENLKPNQFSSTEYKGTVSGAVDYRRAKLSGVLHSYASAFYPWVDISEGDSTIAVPATVAMMGVFGKVRRTSEPWFAPAGFQRGGLSDGSAGLRVVNAKDRLSSGERDTLYDNGINPIANFPAEGVVVFGQKTLQIERSALDRINVRRLMIHLKREIGAVARTMLFEQNVQSTWDNFIEDANAVLEEVKDGLGLIDYRFILDDSTTTPDMVDQNILYAKLYVKPARAIEFIALDFIISATGADFPK